MVHHPFLPVLLGLALAFAGCSARDTSDGDATQPSTTAGLVPVGGGSTQDPGAPSPGQPSPATMNLSRDPVAIDESGDLAQGISKDWEWHVAPGFTSFRAELHFTGPQGAPQYSLQSYQVRLEGGDPRAVVFEAGSGGAAVSVNSAASSCMVCHDGTNDTNQPGLWALHLSAGPSAAAYRVHVVVEY